MKQTGLVIKNLRVSVEGKEILHGVSFAVKPGEVHAVMGPNGSGKSTLSVSLLGHPAYETKAGSHILVNGTDVTRLPAEKRAQSGLYLAFQSPVAIPGVTVMNLLRTAYELRTAEKDKKHEDVQNPILARRARVGSISIGEFTALVTMHAKALRLDEGLLRRGIHDGFSGGEKKKIEMLQALVLPTKFAVFDEIDTGLDVDALKSVSTGIIKLRTNGAGVLVITHYQRILKYVKPDVVHILVDGKIVDQGDASLAKRIESHGYAKYLKDQKAANT